MLFSSETKISFLLWRETEFLLQTGKPNTKRSKTASDKRQRFINKDVLSMKIILTANQNMAQEPKLLSEFCQQTRSRGDRDDATEPF